MYYLGIPVCLWCLPMYSANLELLTNFTSPLKYPWLSNTAGRQCNLSFKGRVQPWRHKRNDKQQVFLCFTSWKFTGPSQTVTPSKPTDLNRLRRVKLLLGLCWEGWPNHNTRDTCLFAGNALVHRLRQRSHTMQQPVPVAQAANAELDMVVNLRHILSGHI